MQQKKIEILSTKMLDKNSFPEEIIIDEIPFIATKAIKDERLEKKISHLAAQPINAIFTSSHAADVVGKIISKNSSWKIFCIGNKTKETLLKFFPAESIAGTADNAADLAWNIMKDISVKNVLFFCGSQRRNELPEILIQNGIDMEELIVYETIKTPKEIKKDYDGVLFFSPSAAESFFSINKIKSHTVCFAIGDTTATTLKKFTTNKIIQAQNQSQQSIMNAMLAHFKISIDE